MLKQLISISLSLFMLFATIGMAKTTHFCMGHEVKSEIGFGEKDVDCGMNMDSSKDEDSPKSDPTSCCQNIVEHMQVEDDFSAEKHTISFDLEFVAAFTQVFIFGIEEVEKEVYTPFHTDSPPPTTPLHILYQTFLI
ncbi:HYC_CC_PP family protein [Algoriphagus kandeliae]